ncbi:unnamed protein product [Closterium sp. Yama58-4]|nr:unnamed protein product [Closterium sp. Yama58-4]
MATSCFNQSPAAAAGAASGAAADEQSAAAKAVRAAKTEVKRLLKTRRQDLGLWAAYARLEAECGNLDASRKVLDTALASVAALPKVCSLSRSSTNSYGACSKGTGEEAEVKRLLKTRRQDLGLWAAYALLEAECGNLDASRKVLDTALASVAALPMSAAEATPLLVLAYTHIELSPTNRSANQHQRPRQQQGRQQSSKGRLHWSINNHWCSLHTLASFAASAPFSAPPPLPPQLDPSVLKESGQITSPSSSWAACKYFPQAALIRARAGFHLKLQEAKKVIAASAAATAAAAASAALPSSSTNPPSANHGAASTTPWSNGAIGSASSSGSTYAGGPTQEESNRATAAVAVVLCASLFELLAAPSLPEGVAGAAAVMDGCTAAVLPGCRACCLPLEMLFERYASLLLHALPAIPPQQVRRVVLQGLKEFPSNTHLLGTFLRLESRSAFTNSIRRFFDQTTARLSHPSPLLWLLSLLVEVARPGARPRVRGLLERALASSAQGSGQCVLMWRLYIGYELHISQNADAARRVFFRAIHTCPWSKALWLDAFTQLHGVIKGEELNELANMMRDKELRLRTDVYEILLQDAQ